MPRAELPLELWLEVFLHLSHDSLRHIALVNRRFANFSRPLRFATLLIHPYAIDIAEPVDSPIRLTPNAALMENVIARLDFFTGSDLAPFVRKCVLQAWPVFGVSYSCPWNRTQVQKTSPYVVLDVLLPRLAGGCFPHLRHLQLLDLVLEWRHLTQLPELETFDVRDVVIVDDPETCPAHLIHTFIVRSFSFATWNPMSPPRTNLSTWLQFMKPGTLHSLSATCQIASLDMVYPCVVTLTLKLYSSPTLRQMTDTLNCFPSAQQVLIRWAGPRNDVPSPETHLTLPLLRQLELRYQCRSLLPLFLGNAGASSHLTHLRISQFSLEDFIDATAGRCAMTIKVLELQLSFAIHTLDIPYARLRTVFDAFPALESVDLHIICTIEDMPSPDFNPLAFDFFRDLALSARLPSQLKNLALRWLFSYESEPSDPAAGYEERDSNDSDTGSSNSEESELALTQPHVPHNAGLVDLRRVREKLAERCSVLEDTFIDGQTFTYWWQGGPAREEFIEDPEHDSAFEAAMYELRGRWRAVTMVNAETDQ
ncbi:hypothetical protein MIND_00635400 [Mycena indigotica]|uniref:F-box domain-containing protein n=1 Tax=Mycena indigotica TaxID=2126181 RepID=A0A8H6SR98_9AGAR|nr:uncharacterized protein MIND_00635400 [Mycena indigotica]KAF7304041.1 hypothetical protein MIND_00635400 [Mycena indigotica]